MVFKMWIHNLFIYLQSDSLPCSQCVCWCCPVFGGIWGCCCTTERMVSEKGQQLPNCNHQFQVKHHVIRVSVIFSPGLFMLKLGCHIFTLFAQLWGPFGVQPAFDYPKQLRIFWKRHDKLEGSLFAPFFSLSVMTMKRVLASIPEGPQLLGLFHPEKWPLSPSICFLSFKQLLVYKTSFPLIPWQLNFFNSLQCGTLSEALWKFKYIMSSESPLSACSLTLL